MTYKKLNLIRMTDINSVGFHFNNYFPCFEGGVALWNIVQHCITSLIDIMVTVTYDVLMLAISWRICRMGSDTESYDIVLTTSLKKVDYVKSFNINYFR